MLLKLNDHLKTSLPLAVMYVESGAVFPLHKHDSLELVVVLAGHGKHICNGEAYEISAGDAFVVGGNLEHGYESTDSLSHFNILFDLEKLAIPVAELRSMPGFLALFEIEPNLHRARGFGNRLKLAFRDLKAAEAKAWEMSTELRELKSGYRTTCCGLLMELIVLLSRAYDESESLACVEARGIGRALQAMENDYAAKHSIDSLAKEAGMSRRNFQRLFTQAVGQSPVQRLLSIRLEKAAEMLVSKDSPTIGEIAFAAGMSDGNYFSRQFSRKFKMSPVRYRDLHKI